LVALVIAVGLLLPLIWVILSSFQPTPDFSAPTPSLFPQHFTTANYGMLGSQLKPLATSIIVATCSALFSVLLGVPAAYALAIFRWRIAPVAVFLVLVTQVVPTVMLATPVYLTFSSLHLLNSIPALVIATSSAGVPFTILVLQAFMADIPPVLREAAYMDGASEFRTLRSVILPISRTAVIASGLFSFLFAWSDLLWALTLNTNGKVVPLPLSIFEFIGQYHIEWGAIMASASIAVIPAIALLVAAQRYISVGLTAGAIKE
jgi:multiple sugar transport system permease protein